MRFVHVALSSALAAGCLLLAPGVASASGGPFASSSAVTHAPRISLKPGKSVTGSGYGWASSNWSGYALSGSAGQYNSITGHWIVPAVQPSAGPTFSSSWLGIDGFNNTNLIQTGTEQDYYNGAAHYDAWWEILPAAETVIPGMTVMPGDHMSAAITNDGNGDWTIKISDLTRNETFTTTRPYSGPAESAEWIQEAPTIGGHVATLANYGQTTFSAGTVNGTKPGLVMADGGVMIQHRRQVSTPSAPDKNKDGFNIAYGSTTPSAPKA